MNLKRKRGPETPDKPFSALCERCWSMTATIEGLRAMASDKGFQHYDSKELRMAVESGCPLCTMLSRFRNVAKTLEPLCITLNPQTEAEAVSDDSGDFQKDHPFSKARFVRLRIRCPNTIFPQTWNQFEVLDIFTIEGDLSARYLNVETLFHYVATNEMFEEIKTRLKNCHKNHRACNFRQWPLLPHRLLDIGSNDSCNIVKLHITEEGERGSYATLSYCWGGPQQIFLTTENVQSFIQGLCLDMLPATIRDAVRVTRNLGIPYLWVDALCIMQNSSVDKAAEIAIMGNIYKNSAITIAAGSAISSKDGFLENKSKDVSPACQVPIYLSENSWGNMWVGNISHDMSIIQEPLEERAWAFQESLLSPRLLFYGSRRIIWKCQTINHQEVAKDPDGNSYFPGAMRLPSSIFDPEMGSGMSTLWNQGRIWRTIVDDYSRRKLTLSEDRLPALGGVASELSKVWQDTYIAGTWRRCLVRHLGWMQKTSEDTNWTTGCAIYTGPTWSWASWPGPIEIVEAYKDDAQVVDYSVTLAEESNPFGRVISGKLTLQAMVVQAPQRSKHIRYSMDKGLSGRRKVTSETRMLLLGYGRNNSSIALMVIRQDDGQYIRVGQARVAKKGLDLWPTEESQRQPVTLV